RSGDPTTSGGARGLAIEQQSLDGATDAPALVPQHALGLPDADRLHEADGLETYPFAVRRAVQHDRQVGVDELPSVPARQAPADPVAEVGGRRDARQRTRRLAGDERHAEPDPVRGRPRLLEAAGDEAMLDTLVVEGGIVEQRDTRRNARRRGVR